MRYNRIRKLDVSNGPGCRISLWTQGCPIHCPGCFNKETWDYNSGREYSKQTEETILDLCEPFYIKGLSILGGEPLIERNLKSLNSLIDNFKLLYPSKTIWLWTGYTEFTREQEELINKIDTIISGPYIDELKNLDNPYYGSTNQRIIQH